MSLEDFPEKVLVKIMEYLDLKDVLFLRKVSHSLRNSIDDFETFDLKLELISITINPEDHGIWIKPPSEPFSISYKKHEKGCQLMFGQTEKLLENENFSVRFFQDLKQLLALKKSTFSYLEFNCPEVPELLENIMKSRTSLIKTQKIQIQTLNQNEFMKILPYTCPNTLEHLGIYSQSNETWKVNRILDCPHWKKVTKFENLSFHMDAKLENFLHFPSANFHIKKLSVEELVIVKEKFHNAPHFSYFFIGYDSFPDSDRLPGVFGPLHIRNEDGIDKGRWYFNLKNTNRNCFYIMHFGNSVWFSILDRESVPRGARVQ